MWSSPPPPWTTRLEPSRPWLRITKAAPGGGPFRPAGVFDGKPLHSSLPGPPKARRRRRRSAGCRCRRRRRACWVAVADDRVALGGADHVLEVAEVVVAVAFGLVGGEVDLDAAAGGAGVGDDVVGAGAAGEGVGAGVAADDVAVARRRRWRCRSRRRRPRVGAAAAVEVAVVAGAAFDLSSPAPPRILSLPLSPKSWSLSPPPSISSLPCWPSMKSAPAPPSSVSGPLAPIRRRCRGRRGGVGAFGAGEVVVAAAAVSMSEPVSP